MRMLPSANSLLRWEWEWNPTVCLLFLAVSPGLGRPFRLMRASWCVQSTTEDGSSTGNSNGSSAFTTLSWRRDTHRSWTSGTPASFCRSFNGSWHQGRRLGHISPAADSWLWSPDCEPQRTLPQSCHWLLHQPRGGLLVRGQESFQDNGRVSQKTCCRHILTSIHGTNATAARQRRRW